MNHKKLERLIEVMEKKNTKSSVLSLEDLKLLVKEYKEKDVNTENDRRIIIKGSTFTNRN